MRNASRTKRRVPLLLVALLAGGALGSPARADRLYHVQMQTSPLLGHPAGPFAIDFQFIDGDGIVNNSVSLFNFAFDGGSAVGTPTTLDGSATGDLVAGVSLDDSSFFNEFVQGFTPGNTLSFDLLTTENFAGGSPDSLTFALLDSGGIELPTSFFDVFFQVDIDGAPPTVQAFGSDPSRAPSAGGPALNIPAPTLSVVSVAPEPGSMALVALMGSLVGASWLRRRGK